MLTVTVVAIGIFGVAVVLPLVLVGRWLPTILIADEVDEYRREVHGSLVSPRSGIEHSAVTLHVVPGAAQQGSSVA
jgi:hypothetical protein